MNNNSLSGLSSIGTHSYLFYDMPLEDINANGAQVLPISPCSPTLPIQLFQERINPFAEQSQTSNPLSPLRSFTAGYSSHQIPPFNSDEQAASLTFPPALELSQGEQQDDGHEHTHLTHPLPLPSMASFEDNISESEDKSENDEKCDSRHLSPASFRDVYSPTSEIASTSSTETRDHVLITTDQVVKVKKRKSLSSQTIENDTKRSPSPASHPKNHLRKAGRKAQLLTPDSVSSRDVRVSSTILDLLSKQAEDIVNERRKNDEKRNEKSTASVNAVESTSNKDKKKNSRRESNKIAAIYSRQRKTLYVQLLENKVLELEKENATLKLQLEANKLLRS